jgi:hypothetical protein
MSVMCSDTVGRAPAELGQSETGAAVRSQAERREMSLVMLRNIEDRAGPGVPQRFAFVIRQRAQRGVGIPLEEALTRHAAMKGVHALLSHVFYAARETRRPPNGRRSGAMRARRRR